MLLFLVVICMFKECPPTDASCRKDRSGFNAIAQLHAQIDDDQDGSLNRAESAEVVIPIILCYCLTDTMLYLLCRHITQVTYHVKTILLFASNNYA